MSDLGLTGSVRMLAGNCAYRERVGNTIHFGLDPRSESYLTRQRKEAMAGALSRYFGEPLSVEISVGEEAAETPHQQAERLSDERMSAARKSLEADPNVQAMQTMFGAEIKADSIELINPQSD